jgi:hypothetical protein
VDQEGVLASLGKFRSLYQALPPYQQREGIRLVIADVKISEEAMEISIHGKPASEAVLEKLRAPGMHSPRRSETSTWLPGLMSQSAVARDYRAVKTGRRCANRLVLTVAR